jgi:hypothetical protein
MEDYYFRLASGVPRASALREAQLTLKETETQPPAIGARLFAKEIPGQYRNSAYRSGRVVLTAILPDEGQGPSAASPILQLTCPESNFSANLHCFYHAA